MCGGFFFQPSCFFLSLLLFPWGEFTGSPSVRYKRSALWVALETLFIGEHTDIWLRIFHHRYIHTYIRVLYTHFLSPYLFIYLRTLKNYSTHRRSKLERALWSGFMFSRALQNERKTFRVQP